MKKYSIGIDLGTTNCALSYTVLEDSSECSQVFPIEQRETAATRISHATLPSFLHRPLENERVGDELEGWVVGAFARNLAAERPETVAHSVKSWLGHHGVDRTARILPWGSTQVAENEKLSPITASALLLRKLRESWDLAFAEEQASFLEQEITITVPASFDAVAQKLTQEAAKEAGYPESVRFLEEPQAAFYRWLEAHEQEEALTGLLPGLSEKPQHVLVIDIGGGTSDFSLFEIALVEGGKLPHIKRVAVSDHILLGGDNVDLALAHLVEPRLDAESLSSKQWSYLVARCRDLKELVLSKQKHEVNSFPVTVPSAGSGLLAGSLTAEVSREEILSLLLEGFFPSCRPDARPARTVTGLREMGLPYAVDSGITRHLAGFLHGRPRVDAVLCNGGTLSPHVLRKHLLTQIADWQSGMTPVVMENPEPDLAVARGAAHYGALIHRPERPRIEAGAARSIYLEIGAKAAESRKLLCILARGTEPEIPVEVEREGLRLQLGKTVEFKPWYSSQRSRDEAGALVDLEEEEFHPLPSLRTTASLSAEDDRSAEKQLLVRLRASLSAVGMLQVECVSLDGSYSWPMEFDLLVVQQQADEEEREKKKIGLRKLVKINFGKGAARSIEKNPAPAAGRETKEETPLQAVSTSDLIRDPGVSQEVLGEARKYLEETLQNPGSRQHPVTTARILKRLQEILGCPKSDWNGVLVRALWEEVGTSFEDRGQSLEHESAWMGLAGFFLRPGYGAPRDEERMDRLWLLHTEGLRHPKKGVKILSHVLWRRVSGGLNQERHHKLLETIIEQLRTAKNPPAEAILLAGSLERLRRETKEELVVLFLDRVVNGFQEGKHVVPYLQALASLLSRTLLYGGAENVLPPEWVERAFEATRDLDWKSEQGNELQMLFLRAARLTGDRQLDVPKPVGKQIVNKLSKSKVAGVRLNVLQEFIPVASADRSQFFGESLPLGLSLDL